MSMTAGKNFGHCGLAALASLILATGLAVAHPHADEPAAYSTAKLEQLVGPIALYPDDLLSVILRASTYPLQIVQATRFLADLEENPKLEPDADWDESVIALLNYPEVIELLDEDLDWTEALGTAVINQEPDVLDAIQQFRERALLAGNLKTDDVQVVRVEDDAIEIESIVQDVLYVPDYEPAQVVIYQSSPAYRYHAFARPVHYYPYPERHYFPSGYFWGVTTHYGIGWLDHGLHAYGLGDYRHPYFRHDYDYRHHYYRGQRYDDRDDTASLGGNRRADDRNRRQDDAAPTHDQPGTAIRPSKSFRPKDRGMVSGKSKTRFRRGTTTVDPNDKVIYHRGTYGKSKRTQPKQRSANVSTSKPSPSKATRTKRSSTRAASSKRTITKSQRTTTTRKTTTAKRSATNKRSLTINRSKPAKVTRSAPTRVNRAPSKTKAARSSTSVKTTRTAAPPRQASTRSATRSPSRSSSAGRSGSTSRSSRAATRGSKR